MVRAEDIVFWILILTIIGISLWLAFGSPEFESSLIAVGLFVAGSEILLWRAFFNIDKKTSIGFERVKFGFEKVKLGFERVDNGLKNIENDVRDVKSNIISINKKLKIK